MKLNKKGCLLIKINNTSDLYLEKIDIKISIPNIQIKETEHEIDLNLDFLNNQIYKVSTIDDVIKKDLLANEVKTLIDLNTAKTFFKRNNQKDFYKITSYKNDEVLLRITKSKFNFFYKGFLIHSFISEVSENHFWYDGIDICFWASVDDIKILNILFFIDTI